jgi:hypothetical protein
LQDAVRASAGSRRSEDSPWWACSRGCNDDIVSEYRIWTREEAEREMVRHTQAVRVQREHVEHEIAQILGAESDAEHFVDRMADERQRTAEETLALIRGTDRRPTVTEQAEERSKDVEAGKWKGKQRRGVCAWCKDEFLFYPSRQPGTYCSLQCRSRRENLKRSRG